MEWFLCLPFGDTVCVPAIGLGVFLCVSAGLVLMALGLLAWAVAVADQSAQLSARRTQARRRMESASRDYLKDVDTLLRR
jgi:hypothetical protein